jgi:Recombinase/Recombinase zinc beta ribbon domain
MTVLDLPDTAFSDGMSVLSWLQTVADRSSTDEVMPTIIPVAWMGRTSTDDQQDPTLSLPRQLENTRRALPAPFVIVAKFYDIESGRNELEFRGHGDAHERFDIPIARDGGIADMLEEAKRPDRRFVAVACESIERVARVSYFSTKIEYELAQVGVALLAADEGIKPNAVLRTGGERPKQATQILTRRVKQAISEWYVVNMLELSWDGVIEHTRQGWNIGKPPYGYIAERHPHPVKAKRDDGKVKTRLVPDPVRGKVVTQIFQMRALQRLGAQDIADRLNLDLERYPPPEPIPGKGRRAIGAWTKTSVLDLLANPKYTGYMVWNRRKRSRPERHVPGKVNPPSEWVWSPHPTHEPLVTKAIFDAATPIARLRQGSRTGAGPNTAHRQAQRSYVLRSYLVCDLCGRRMFGKTRVRRGQETTYYACVTNPEHHQGQSWYAQHPSNFTVREDHLMSAVGTFFGERILGPHRAMYLNHRPSEPEDDGTAVQRAVLRKQLDQLGRAQVNLMRQLEDYEPTGDDDIDSEWRTALQRRFAQIADERRTVSASLTALDKQTPSEGRGNPALLDLLPQGAVDPTLLPEEDQRELYDAFHLQVRYDRAKHQVTLRATIYAEAVGALTKKIRALNSDDGPCTTVRSNETAPVVGMPTAGARSHVVSAPGRIRTCATASGGRCSIP